MPLLTVDPKTCRAVTLQPAVDWLRGGGIVAVPTDTFYGLAVDPTSASAVSALFALKGRPAGAALPLVAASLDQVVRAVGNLPAATRSLGQKFWPGPLSVIVDAPASIDAGVHAGRGSVAIRVPDQRVTVTLTEAWENPLTATSANPSGAPPARTVEDLFTWAADDILFIIDAGPAPGGAPSTIVDVRKTPPTLVREGAIAWNRVLESLKE